MQFQILNVYGRSFFMDSQVYNDHHLGCFAPLSTIEVSQNPENLDYSLPGLRTATSSIYENTSQRPLPSNRHSVPHIQTGIHQESIQIARKRALKVGDSIHNTAEKESKKKKVMCMGDQRQACSENPSETQEHRAPVKKSQKLGEKITALQKLVSPFGKTDTASVLQEASVQIKLLQEQIHMLSAPYFISALHTHGFGGQELDLESRGLCLVPVSFTQNLTKEDTIERSI